MTTHTISCRNGSIHWGKEYPSPETIKLSYMGSLIQWIKKHKNIENIFYRFHFSGPLSYLLPAVGIAGPLLFAFTVTPWALGGLLIVPLYAALRVIQNQLFSLSSITNLEQQEMRFAKYYHNNKDKIEEEKRRIIESLGGEKRFNNLPILKLEGIGNSFDMIHVLMKGTTKQHQTPFLAMIIQKKNAPKKIQRILFYQSSPTAPGWSTTFKCDNRLALNFLEDLLKGTDEQYQMMPTAGSLSLR